MSRYSLMPNNAPKVSKYGHICFGFLGSGRFHMPMMPGYDTVSPVLNSNPTPENAYSVVPPLHEFASISAHTFSMCFRFSLAASRFCRVRSSRCARKHMLTLYFASVQLPRTLWMKPRAWHSSRAAITSAQSTTVSQYT